MVCIMMIRQPEFGVSIRLPKQLVGVPSENEEGLFPRSRLPISPRMAQRQAVASAAVGRTEVPHRLISVPAMNDDLPIMEFVTDVLSEEGLVSYQTDCMRKLKPVSASRTRFARYEYA